MFFIIAVYLQLTKPFRSEKAAEVLPFKKFKPLIPLDLQLFAEDDDDQDDDQDDDDQDDDEDDGPNLDELLKDPKFKKQYQAKMKEQLGKRLKKYKDVDPEEYRRLKEQAGKGKKKDKDEDEDDTSNNKKDVEKLLRAERREKRAAIKEFAVDNGYNQKLLARLIDVDAVELDEDGEPENLEELFEEIQDEFPEYFSQDDENEDDEEEEDKKKSKSKTKSKTFKPGSKQKGNSKKKVDVRARGAERAKARHKKEDNK